MAIKDMTDHKVQHSLMGIPEAMAVVDAWPNTPQVYCSPISGDPDLTKNESISGIQHMGTGFLLPKNGYLDEINIICQGNTGTGIAQNVRWSVAQIHRYPDAETGLAIGPVVATGLTTVADNAAGKVTLATGLNLSVPAQFMVFVKGGFKVGAESINVQAMLSGGPIPGVVGAYSGGLISAAAYMAVTTNFADPPGTLVENDKVMAASFKGISVYIKWKGEQA